MNHDVVRSRGPGNVTTPVRLRNMWSVEHDYFKREPVGAVHRLNRKAAWA